MCRFGFFRRSSGWTLFFFFFQAEDGIRDPLVTGVQTCALPISLERLGPSSPATGDHVRLAQEPPGLGEAEVVAELLELRDDGRPDGEDLLGRFRFGEQGQE